MNIWLRLFLFLCIYSCLPITVLMLRNETKPKKNVILGTTLPQQARSHHETQAVCAAFKRHLTAALILLTLVCLAGVFIPYTSIAITFYLCWLVAAIVVPMVLHAKANTRLRRLKEREGWRSALAGRSVAELKSWTFSQQAPSAWWFLPPAVITLIPVFAALLRRQPLSLALFPHCTMALIVLIFYLSSRFLYRKKAEAIDTDAAVTMALTRIRRYNWGKCWLWASYLTALWTLVPWLFPYNQTALLVSCLVYLAVLLYCVMRVEMETRKMQQELSASSGSGDYIDEDDYWIWGMFYHNINDSHLIINNRVGINTTVNLARPAGKVIIALSALLIAALPFLGIWMIPEEFTPITAAISGEQIAVQHTKQEYAISLDDVTSVQLLETLPGLTKLVGTGFDTLAKGTFNVQGVGKCSVCLNPQKGPFLLIQTDSRTYLIGTGSPEQTVQLYDDICSRLN